MASDVDELDINPFFQALQNKFLDLYDRAQEKCFTICIPQTTSIAGSDINRDFAETHVLKPSPYFQGQLLTCHTNQGKTVMVSGDGCSFTTSEGFQQTVTAKIVSEELAYNKEYSQYRVLILDQPLDSKFLPKQCQVQDSSRAKAPDQIISVKESKKFLHLHPELTKVISKVEERVRQFNQNYMVLPEYLDEAAQRLADISAEGVQGCVRAAGRKYTADVRWRDMLTVAMENVVMSGAQGRVCGVIRSMHGRQDHALAAKCRSQLQGISAADLGIQKRFACPLPEAERELSKMDWLVSPREKLYCLKSVMDSIMSGITAHLHRDVPPHLALVADKPCLTSDDLIPILVHVIGHAECQYLHSDTVYMDTFSWASTANDLDDLSYCLVTFKAAVQYICDTDFSELTHKHKKQASMDRLSSATDRLSLSRGDHSPSPRVSPVFKGDHTPSPRISPTSDVGARRSPSVTSSGGDRLDRQRSRISKALEDPATKHASQDNKLKSIFGAEYNVPGALQEAAKSNAQPDLGDFLSSLQDDFVGFGQG